jgi:signal transduction histidine kinase
MRIGQDLHDGLCQNLVAIDCAAACLRADLEAKDLPEAATAEAIQKLLREAVVEARDLARGIFPVQMDAEGLQAALAELVAKTNRSPQVTVTLQILGEVGVEDPQVGMHLYRIAQQALNNALTHAQARQIDIRLCREGERLTLTINDDGRGFAQSASPSRGMGLRTMQYRARLIGGALTVTSTPEAGTEVRCLIIFSHAHND